MSKKKIFLGLFILAATVVSMPVFGAFEAHVVNVTAQIENGLLTLIDEIDFGTTFPQEQLDREFSVQLSEAFLADEVIDDVDYVLRQKPKCWDGNDEEPIFGQVTEDDQGNFYCVDEELEMLPLLCPYLSKTELTADGGEIENDSEGITAFHGLPGPWNMDTTLLTQVKGRLIQSANDISDTWNIDLKVPCFEGHCAQDWNDFVLGVNPEANPDDYIQPAENEHKLFGCDLWLEVTGLSYREPCTGQLDLMLVLDRSGSINSSELQILKNAANAFVTALSPTASGTHIGQTSFSTNGTLDLHLTDDESAVHGAINGLSSSGFTNLKEGIELATAELDDLHVHERPTAPDVMVIITDGAPNRPTGDPAGDAAAAADAARADSIEIFVVGIGVSTSTEAYLKADIADDDSHYFAAGDFGDLEAILAGLPVCPED